MSYTFLEHIRKIDAEVQSWPEWKKTDTLKQSHYEQASSLSSEEKKNQPTETGREQIITSRCT